MTIVTKNVPDLAASTAGAVEGTIGFVGSGLVRLPKVDLAIAASYAVKSAGNALKIAALTDGTRAVMGGVVYVTDSTATGANSAGNAFGVDGYREAGPIFTTRAQAALAITAGDIANGDIFEAAGTKYKKTTATGIDNVFESEFAITGVGYVGQSAPFYVDANTFTEILAEQDAFKIEKFAQGDTITIPDGTRNGQRFIAYFYCDYSHYEEGFVRINAKGVTRNEFHQIRYRDVTGVETIPIRKGETLECVWDGPASRWIILNHNLKMWSGTVGNTKWEENENGRFDMWGQIGTIAANTDVLFTFPSMDTGARSPSDATNVTRPVKSTTTNYTISYEIRNNAASGATATVTGPIQTITRSSTLDLLQEFAVANPDNTNSAFVRFALQGAELDYVALAP